MKPGTYVIDTSDSGRYDRAVYCTIKDMTTQTVVRYVGSVRNGRLEYAREQPITHRTTSKLQEWNN